ncbi:MAG: hypothetical protein Q9225_004721, partial [Loekoesia sp. 1 TL-2023]
MRDIDTESTHAYNIEARSMQLIVLDLIAGALRVISDDWDSVCEHAEETLSSTEKIFNNTVDDQLLFDDDMFSSSRKYSWLITSLHDFEATVSETIYAWEQYKSQYIRPYLESESLVPIEEKISVRRTLCEAEKAVQNMRHVQKQFVRQHAQSLAFRDGLIAASSVRESKMSTALAATSYRLAETSTRLAENIKLLTYVSIFYLPLSFCV